MSSSHGSAAVTKPIDSHVIVNLYSTLEARNLQGLSLQGFIGTNA
jgi:hypothetical protein